MGANDIGTQRTRLATLGSRGGSASRGFRGSRRSGFQPGRSGLSSYAASGRLFVCPTPRRGSITPTAVPEPRGLRSHLNELRRKFDIVMAWAIDRLGRSLSDLLDTIQHLEACGVERAMSPRGAQQ